jgi:hypothetical protein
MAARYTSMLFLGGSLIGEAGGGMGVGRLVVSSKASPMSTPSNVSIDALVMINIAVIVVVSASFIATTCGTAMIF